MSTELATQTTQLPATRTGSVKSFKKIAKANDFIGRMQLFSKGKAVNKRLIAPGNYGIAVSDDEVVDLGDKIDVMVYAYRPKALDTTDKKNIVVNFEEDSEIFKSIETRSYQKNSPCMFGISFLVFERGSGRFLEYYCRTKTARAECGQLEPFLPVSAVDVEAAAAEGVELEERGATPVTLGSRFKEAGDFSWHIMTVHKCSQPFKNLPPQEEINEEIVKFLNQKSTDVKAKAAAEEKRVR